MTNNKFNAEEALVGMCGFLSKYSEDKEALSEWMEGEFGVSLWSIADMKPETLKEILDKKKK